MYIYVCVCIWYCKALLCVAVCCRPSRTPLETVLSIDAFWITCTWFYCMIHGYIILSVFCYIAACCSVLQCFCWHSRTSLKIVSLDFIVWFLIISYCSLSCYIHPWLWRSKMQALRCRRTAATHCNVSATTHYNIPSAGICEHWVTGASCICKSIVWFNIILYRSLVAVQEDASTGLQALQDTLTSCKTDLVNLQVFSVCSSVLRCVAVRCSVLQCAALWCNVLQCFIVPGHPRCKTEDVYLQVYCSVLLQCTATHRNRLQHTATPCNTLQDWTVHLQECCGVLRCVAVCCGVLWFVAMCCSVLQCVTVRCSVLQCVAVCCGVLQDWTRASASMLQCVEVCCGVLQRVAMCFGVLQCIVVCWKVLQCVAMCCIVLQCVAMCCSMLRYVVVCCGVLRCVALSCGDRQCYKYLYVHIHTHK